MTKTRILALGGAAALLCAPLLAATGPAAPLHEIAPKASCPAGECPAGPKAALEKATFLGVAASNVSPELAAQLNLPEGTGLIVQKLVKDSPAAEALKKFDVLTKLDDQILVDGRQLAVLVRMHKEGDEIALTYVRGGKTATVKVKLASKEMPPLGQEMPPGPMMWRHMGDLGSMPLPGGADPGRMLGVFGGGPDGRLRIFERRINGPLHATQLDAGNSTLLLKDDDGSEFRLTIQDGKKHLTAKDGQGKLIYDGAVDTPEQRKALPEALRQKLDRLESMRDLRIAPPGQGPHEEEMMDEEPPAPEHEGGGGNK